MCFRRAAPPASFQSIRILPEYTKIRNVSSKWLPRPGGTGGLPWIYPCLPGPWTASGCIDVSPHTPASPSWPALSSPRQNRTRTPGRVLTCMARPRCVAFANPRVALSQRVSGISAAWCRFSCPFTLAGQHRATDMPIQPSPHRRRDAPRLPRRTRGCQEGSEKRTGARHRVRNVTVVRASPGHSGPWARRLAALIPRSG